MKSVARCKTQGIVDVHAGRVYHMPGIEELNQLLCVLLFLTHFLKSSFWICCLELCWFLQKCLQLYGTRDCCWCARPSRLALLVVVYSRQILPMPVFWTGYDKQPSFLRGLTRLVLLGSDQLLEKILVHVPLKLYFSQYYLQIM